VAGEWIKVRTNLWDDPRIGQLCELTDQGEAAVIGGLYWLWATADEHSADGLLHGMTTRTIDRKTGVPGLGKALVTIGWLTESDGGVTVERFEEHNGASAKQRALTAKRVSNHKANAKVTQPALPKTDDGVTDPLPREDKNKKEEPPIPPKGGDALPRTKSEAITLQAFLANCEAKGERPLRNYVPLWRYAEEAKLPKDHIALAWVEFCRRFLPDGTGQAKRYKDWRQAFRKYVEGNYLKLWAIDGNGEYFLTTQGKQAQKVHAEKEAA
jgi:hypothetical protein